MNRFMPLATYNKNHYCPVNVLSFRCNLRYNNHLGAVTTVFDFN